MAYLSNISLDTLENNSNFKNAKGNTECVELVRQISIAPNTALWKKGKRVLDCAPNEIPKGTVIATFDSNGKYPSGTGRHAAVYISHTISEIKVIDQWNGQGKSKSRTIRFKKSSEIDVNDSNWYYIVE